MATSADTSALIGALNELSERNGDAVEAFEAASTRMHRPADRCRMALFYEDHVHHGVELANLLRELGAPPAGAGAGVMRARLFAGGIVADRLILEAMKRNEEEVFAALELAASQHGLPERARASLEQALVVERIHRAWIADQLYEVEGLLLLPL